jgi:RHS repeat-associated protein
VTFTYDADGNQSIPGQNATWDYENRLSGYDVSALGFRPKYDADNRRVQMVFLLSGSPFGTINYFWDHENIIRESTLASGTTYRFTYEPELYGLLVSHWNGSEGKRYEHFDALGSVVAVTSTAGAVSATRIYDAYGQQIAISGNLSAFAYVGQLGYAVEVIPTRYYVRARYYRADLGTWLSLDPIGFRTRDPNWYRYLRNLALRQTDPSGLDSNSPCVIVNRHQDGSIPPAWLRFAADLASAEEILEGPQTWNAITTHMSIRECCEVIFVGHRGNFDQYTNPGGCSTFVQENRPNARRRRFVQRRLLPDTINEFDLETTFKDSHCEKCRIVIQGCGDADDPVHHQTLQNIANSTGCEVCGTKTDCAPDGISGGAFAGQLIGGALVVNANTYRESLICKSKIGEDIVKDPPDIRRPRELRG